MKVYIPGFIDKPVPYPEVFWAYCYMQQDRNFKESIEEHIVRQTAQQKIVAFRCQTTKLSYKIIRLEEWAVIKLIRVKKARELFKNLGSFSGHPYQFNDMKIHLGTAL